MIEQSYSAYVICGKAFRGFLSFVLCFGFTLLIRNDLLFGILYYKGSAKSRRGLCISDGKHLPRNKENFTVQCAGKETVFVMITITERSDDLVYLAAFVALVHAPDPADNLLLAPPEENTAKKCHE